MKAALSRTGAVVLLAIGACTTIIDPQVGAGLGASCASDDQCQGSSCIDGICAIHCGDSNGCPGGTVCATGACQLPLRTGFVFPFDLDQDEIGSSIDAGREQAEEELGYVESEVAVGFMLSSAATEKATELVEDGAEVIVSTSTLHATAFADFADTHPDVEVLTYQGTRAGPNLVPFDARTYQVYFMAGRAAARYTTTHRIGILGSTMTPPILASINAFALGAQKEAGVDPITVELRWIGEPHDTKMKVDGKTRERRFTEELVANGCDVIAHTMDNSIPLFTIQELNDGGATVFGIGANVEDACSALSGGRCIGSTFFRWGPLLGKILDDFHRERLDTPAFLVGITSSDTDSPIGFQVGDGLSGGTSLATDLEGDRVTFASESGVGSVFKGPITSTGDCEIQLAVPQCVADGQFLTDNQLSTMCWLVNGVVLNAANEAARCTLEGTTCSCVGVAE